MQAVALHMLHIQRLEVLLSVTFGDGEAHLL